MNHKQGRKRKKIEIKGQSHFNLQLTSIVDMLTILLVFLLQNFSASATNFEAPTGLKLPISSSVVEPTEVLKMELTPNSLKLEGKNLSLEVDKNDPEFLFELFNALDSKAKEKMAEQTTDKTTGQTTDKTPAKTTGQGQILLMANQDVPYSLIKQVFYTVSMAGYPQVKMATILEE